jgi:hypothetical protein
LHARSAWDQIWQLDALKITKALSIMIMQATTPGLLAEGSETPTSQPLLKRATTGAGLVPVGSETPT